MSEQTSGDVIMSTSDSALPASSAPETAKTASTPLEAVAAAPVASTSGSSAPPLTVPPGFRVHTESSTSILIPDEKKDTKVVFLNPVQEYNRDLSIVAIRAWSELKSAEDVARREKQRAKRATGPASKKRKLNAAAEASTTPAVQASAASPVGSSATVPAAESAPSLPSATATSEAPPALPPYRFSLFEALSATGLRSIRYAKEIPLLNWVLANDLSHSAVQSIRANIALNGLAPPESAPGAPPVEGRVRVSEADATAVLYSHRTDRTRFDVIDLDPYGTAAPFIDGAVQAVRDGGLLCVTCTDLAVLAGGSYPEKAYSNYGGVTVKTEFCHEVALRLVLNSLATAASRYGRHIKPLLSLSIDFYVRLFVRVYASPAGTKRALTSAGTIYACTSCQSTHVQPLGRATTTDPANTNESFRNSTGPNLPGTVCDECGGRYHLGGPLWIGPLHDREFIERMLEHVRSPEATYGTKERIRGMITIAQSELETPFYFTPAKLAGFFHCTAPSLANVASALLHLGHDVSRSHAAAGSLKTTAPRAVVMDLMRTWVLSHPVNLDNVRDGSPTKALLARECRTEGISFAHHPDVERKMLTKIKLVKYQEPPPGHGPGKRASMKQGKRKAGEDEAVVQA